MEQSSLGRILGVLTNPGSTFRSIRERPTWGLMLLALVLITMGSTYVVMSKIDPSAMVDQMRAQMEKQGEVDEDQLETLAGFALYPATFGAGIVAGLGVFIGSAILWLLMKVVGGEFGYKTSLAVGAYASAPMLLASLLRAIVALTKDEIQPGDAQGGLLMSNLAAFAPEDASSTLKAGLASIDLFALWSLGLAVVGYAIVSKVSYAKTASVCISLWLVFVGISVGAASFA